MLSFPLLKLLLEYSQDIFNFVIISHLLLMYNIHERITQFYKDAASVQVKIFVFCWDSQSPLHVYIFNFLYSSDQVASIEILLKSFATFRHHNAVLKSMQFFFIYFISRISIFSAVDVGSIPGQGTKIPHAMGQLSSKVSTRKPLCHNERSHISQLRPQIRKKIHT